MSNDTILVVDDSPTDLRVITGPLLDKGYRVITAVDGEEALEKAIQEHPRLIVLDVILPKKNGFQVCRQLKTSPDTQDIKIIMLTSKHTMRSLNSTFIFFLLTSRSLLGNRALRTRYAAFF